MTTGSALDVLHYNLAFYACFLACVFTDMCSRALCRQCYRINELIILYFSLACLIVGGGGGGVGGCGRLS